MARKKFQELDLKDAFLFAAALSDEETCRLLLEVILEEPVTKVTVHAEHTLLYSSDYRGIRLDIYAQDEQQKGYNVEMQGMNKGNLPKRSRYHQAEMDATMLEPGEDFNSLHPCYIIFICTFDPFGKGLYRYSFENRCLEADIPLGDETKKIFLNTKGENSEQVPAQLVHFLRYVENSTDECAAREQNIIVEALHKRVNALKKSREWERRYMTFGELLQEAKQEGHAEGHAEGQQSMLTLIAQMTQAGEDELIPRLVEDASFLEEMYQKYHL